MHAVGLHSALAIKRQRKRRDDQRRAVERRYSIQSGESEFVSLGASTVSFDHSRIHKKIKFLQPSMRGLDYKVATSIGMLHVGIVFLLLGAFLLISELLPNDSTISKKGISRKWWNELIAIGLFSLFLGVFFIFLNIMVTKKEERSIEKYVQHQLTQSKSDYHQRTDAETGILSRKYNKDSSLNALSEPPNNITENIDRNEFVHHKMNASTYLLENNYKINSNSADSNYTLEQIVEEELSNNV